MTDKFNAYINSRAYWTFQYRVVGQNEWKPKVDTWKTFTGARKAADKWCVDMLANGCSVVVRVGRIVNNHFEPTEA